MERKIRVKRIEERLGNRGGFVILAKMEEEDVKGVLKKKDTFRRRSGVKVNEYLTLEERKVRWRMVERAREERMKRTRVVVANRRMWIEGQEWMWEEEEGGWRRK